MLVEACVEMQQFERAVECGKEMERYLASVLATCDPGAAKVLRLSQLPNLHAALARAHEGLGRMKECMQCHNCTLEAPRGLGKMVVSMEMLSVFERHAQLLLKEGKVAGAEELLLGLPLRTYKMQLEMRGGLAQTSSGTRAVLFAMQRRLGKKAEARALAQDLDETEAVLASVSAAAPNELREEQRAETAVQVGPERAAGAGAGGKKQPKKKSKLTRKQRKRKAAQRRRQAGAAEQAAAGEEAEAEEADVEVEAEAEEEEDIFQAALKELGLEEPVEPAKAEPEPEECAICLNDLAASRVEEAGAVQLVCTHAFHADCLERWKDKCLEKGLPYTCAMCRRTVVLVVLVLVVLVAAAAAASGEAQGKDWMRGGAWRGVVDCLGFSFATDGLNEGSGWRSESEA